MSASRPAPIVWAAGPSECHEAADRYNRRLMVELAGLESDLHKANAWNDYERFGTGFFSQTRPPVPTAHLAAQIAELCEELVTERARIAAMYQVGDRLGAQ